MLCRLFARDASESGADRHADARETLAQDVAGHDLAGREDVLRQARRRP